MPCHSVIPSEKASASRARAPRQYAASFAPFQSRHVLWSRSSQGDGSGHQQRSDRRGSPGDNAAHAVQRQRGGAQGRAQPYRLLQIVMHRPKRSVPCLLCSCAGLGWGMHPVQGGDVQQR